MARMLPSIIKLRYLPFGISFFYFTNILFDYMLYPFVIYRTGIIAGGICMFILSLITCLAVLACYDKMRIDWLGIETIRELRNHKPRNFIEQVVTWLLQKSDPVAFVALSLYQDPFITTVWLRREQFAGMSLRDWRIFMGSLLLGNAFWALSCWLGVNAFIWAWRKITF